MTADGIHGKGDADDPSADGGTLLFGTTVSGGENSR
jgi:hypothetical protein